MISEGIAWHGNARTTQGVEKHWNDKQQQGEGKKRELCIGKALNSYGDARHGTDQP